MLCRSPAGFRLHALDSKHSLLCWKVRDWCCLSFIHLFIHPSSFVIDSFCPCVLSRSNPFILSRVLLFQEFPFNRWVHVVVTCDSSTGSLRLFLDGELAGERHFDHKLKPNAGTCESAVAGGN